MIVIANTTPINYLVIIEQVDILHEMYGRVYSAIRSHRTAIE